MVQVARFPLDYLNISQGENGSFSHQGTKCIDFVGKTKRYPYYAPCDCEVIARLDSDAILVFKSSEPVLCADGVTRNIVWDCIHDDTLLYTVGAKLKQGDLMGRTGTGGFATGDHLHLNVIEGNTYNGFVQKPHYALAGNELHIYDVFALGEVEVVNDFGYPWKTSDYIPPTDPGEETPESDQNKIYHLWLSGSMRW